MSIASSFLLLAVAVVCAALYGIHRYRTPLNPLTVFAVIQIGLITLTSGLVAYSFSSEVDYPPEVLTKTVWISLAYFAGNIAAYLFLGNLPVRLYGWLMGFLQLSSERIATRFSWFKFLVLLGCACGAFATLAIVGGGGMRWLTDTRAVYITNRAGVGPFFAAMQWFLVFALLYYLWACRPRGIRLIVITCLFALAAYFSGSKNNILTMLVIGIVYYNFCVRRIPIVGYLAFVAMILCLFSVLLIIHGMTGNLHEVFRFYFRDYFDTTAQFLWRFDEFGYRYGGASVSDLWFYVPRGLFPDKPYEYGVLLIHQVLFPGAAATGNTPGILVWAMAYLDFGVIGVFTSGLLCGFGQRAAFEYFLKHRHGFFAFFLMMQFALLAPLPFATAGMTFILAISLGIYFRLVLEHRQIQAPLLAKSGRQC